MDADAAGRQAGSGQKRADPGDRREQTADQGVDSPVPQVTRG
jgi:hypothetical protein